MVEGINILSHKRSLKLSVNFLILSHFLVLRISQHVCDEACDAGLNDEQVHNAEEEAAVESPSSD